ncbi:MAG: hypothetical protein ISR65_19110 [Bacteriovoracaceae bacterium]|nr:hypothetical protein [Bacteriovoracaceae bacterium]
MHNLNLYLLIYLAMILSLATFADRFYSKIYHKLVLILVPINHWFVSWTKALPQNRAEHLISWLLEFEGSIFLDQLGRQKQLPKYKFYTSLILSILHYTRRFGSPARSIFNELRYALIKDDQFEKKLGSELLGGVMQFFMTSLITWGFCLMASSLVLVSIDQRVYIVVFLLQLIGAATFILIYWWSKKKYFANFENYFHSLYILKALSQVGVSIQEAIKESKIVATSKIEFKAFNQIKLKTQKMIQQWQTRGISPNAGLEDILQQLWFIQEQRFIKFIKFFSFVKFLILATFFLGAYAVYLLSLFTFFMENS